VASLEVAMDGRYRRGRSTLLRPVADAEDRGRDLVGHLLLEEVAGARAQHLGAREQPLDPADDAAEHRIAVAPHHADRSLERLRELLASLERRDRRMRHR